MNKILLMSLLLALTGCGEAVFYKHVHYSDLEVENSSRINNLVLSVSSSLGYLKCDVGFCKDNSSFSIEHLSGNSFELKFFHSFGFYSGQKNKDVIEFTSKLEESCESCVIKEKNSSIWGFVANNSDWVQVHP